MLGQLSLLSLQLFLADIPLQAAMLKQGPDQTLALALKLPQSLSDHHVILVLLLHQSESPELALLQKDLLEDLERILVNDLAHGNRTRVIFLFLPQLGLLVLDNFPQRRLLLK